MRTLPIIFLLIAVLPARNWCEDVSFQAGGGPAIPSTPEGFTQIYKTGWSIAGGMGFIISPLVVLTGSVEYSRFPFDDADFVRLFGFSNSGYVISGGDRSIITATMNTRFLLSRNRNMVCPYFVAGIGFAHFSQAEATVAGFSPIIGAHSESAVLIHGGGGIDIPASDHVSLFLEGRYDLALIQMNTTAFWPISAGIRVGV